MSIKTGYAEINETRLYYEVTGSGDPLVFVHGWGFDTRAWKYQFEEFARQYKVIRYDQRGFGKSAQPLSREIYSHASDLKALLEYLDIKIVHLLGHSFGGRHVTIFAIEYP